MPAKNETETSYVKGEKFELLFAEFMKSDLGWDGYVIRSQQKGKANSRGSQVDIIAKRKDARGTKLFNLGLIYSCISILILAIAFIFNWSLILMLLSFSFFLILGIGLIINSQNYHIENAWVECKNRKTKTVYEDVVKSLTEFNDYEASGDKEYKYVEHYFVSAEGFVENALKLALDNGIICYEYNKNKKFEKVTYWK